MLRVLSEDSSGKGKHSEDRRGHSRRSPRTPGLRDSDLEDPLQEVESSLLLRTSAQSSHSELPIAQRVTGNCLYM